MKILIVAHPDDEIIWFNPESFDSIIILFGTRHDKPTIHSARIQSIIEHPLKNKIVFYNLMEPGYWKDKTRRSYYCQTYNEVYNIIARIVNKNISIIFTHNSIGEYGHSDHILVHYAVKNFVQQEALTIPIWCPIKNMTFVNNYLLQEVRFNLNLYNNIKNIYQKNGAWTWNPYYKPQDSEKFYRAY